MASRLRLNRRQTSARSGRATPKSSPTAASGAASMVTACCSVRVMRAPPCRAECGSNQEYVMSTIRFTTA